MVVAGVARPSLCPAIPAPQPPDPLPDACMARACHVAAALQAE